MKIIVTFAVRTEFAPWRRMWNFERVGEKHAPIYLARRDRTEVYAVITGIGMRGAQTQLGKLLAQPADICVTSGLAGSLKRQHSAGRILVAKATRRDNTETCSRSDDHLVKLAAQCEATPVDFFYTSGAVVSSASQKLSLGETADAVDMESFYVMSEARRHGVPAVAVRAISDPVDRNLPLDFNRAVGEDGKIGWLPALSQIVAAPGRLPQLVRFGFESSRAARKLAHFLERYLNCLTAEAKSHLNIAHTEVG